MSTDHASAAARAAASGLRFLAARLRTICLTVFLLGLVQTLAAASASAGAADPCGAACARAPIPAASSAVSS